MERAGHATCMREMRDAYILVGKYHLGNTSVNGRRVDNIKMNPGDTGSDNVDWIHLAQDTD
jgi:hypothetical protein